MGLLGWIFYIITGIGMFFIIGVIDKKYNITKLQKLVFSILLMMIVSGVCFRFAIIYTDNIFITLIFLMVTDIIYNSYFIEIDFFNKDDKNMIYYTVLVIIGFIVNQEFINDVNAVFLTGEDLRIVLWFLGIIFIYNFCREKDIFNSVDIVKNKMISVDSVLVSYAKLKHKYYNDCNFSDKNINNIIFAIMIYYNNKRSKILRDYDYFMFRLNGNSRKLSIMQIDSRKFITDKEGIDIVYNKLDKLYTKLNTGKKKSFDYNLIIDKYMDKDSEYVKYIYEIISKF